MSGTEWPNPLRVARPALTYAKLMTSSLAETHGNNETVTRKTAASRCALALVVVSRRRSDTSTAAMEPTDTRSQIRLRTVTNFLVFYRNGAVDASEDHRRALSIDSAALPFGPA